MHSEMLAVMSNSFAPEASNSRSKCASYTGGESRYKGRAVPHDDTKIRKKKRKAQRVARRIRG